MSNYIARLMHQSGLKVAAAENPSAAVSAVQETVAGSPPADVIEQEAQNEAEVFKRSPVPAVAAHETLVRLHADSGSEEPQSYFERRREDEVGLETPLAAQPSGTLATSVGPESSAVSIGETEPRSSSEQQAPLVKTAYSPTQPSTNDSAVAVPTSSEIVQEVLAWMADSRGAAVRPNPAGSGASASDISSPALSAQVVAVNPSTQPRSGDNIASPIPDRSLSGRPPVPEPIRLAAPPAEDEPSWSVHIDTIHLTIEDPTAKPGPQPVERSVIPPAAPPQPRFRPSRLRRHYLRTF